VAVTWVPTNPSRCAAALRGLGVHRATDLAGGVRAWLAAGLATVPGA
jgi:rhodanese-related sulfurtransferase